MTGNDYSELTNSSENPRIAVTGAAGYIGSRVLVEMRNAHPEWEIIAIDNQYRGQVESVGDVEIQDVDIRNRDDLEEALTGADVVCHLAGVSGVDDCEKNADLAYDINITGTNNVSWFCRKAGAALIFPFSMAVLGDPGSFPITADLTRDPLNWYGRTKAIGEQTIRAFADGEFPAHLYLKSNLYGEHKIEDSAVGKPTVINFFVNRVVSGETLTVYKPGTQARNFVHVKDVARVYVRSTERLIKQIANDVTGVETYEIAGREDMSVMSVAEIVQEISESKYGMEADIELVPNPRPGETMVKEFGVDISTAETMLGWHPEESIRDSVDELLSDA